MYIMDPYLTLQPILRRELQLVGVSALLVACKYEEIWAPEVNDFILISDSVYSREQILNVEKGKSMSLVQWAPSFSRSLWLVIHLNHRYYVHGWQRPRHLAWILSSRADLKLSVQSTANIILISKDDDLSPCNVVCGFATRLIEQGIDVKLIKWSDFPNVEASIMPTQVRGGQDRKLMSKK